MYIFILIIITIMIIVITIITYKLTLCKLHILSICQHRNEFPQSWQCEEDERRRVPRLL